MPGVALAIRPELSTICTKPPGTSAARSRSWGERPDSMALRTESSCSEALLCSREVIDSRTESTSHAPATYTAMPVTSIATSVIRSRTLPSRSRTGDHPVPRAAHRDDRVPAEGRVDLLAQVADVHL